MLPMRVVAAVITVTLLAAGCGAQPGAAPTTTSPTTTTTTASSPAGAPSQPSPPVAEQLRFTAKTVDGADFSGASLAGKPAVLWFWAPWCPKCQREAPGLSAAAKELGSSVTFVGVAALDEVPAMRQFVQRFDLKSFQHIADTDSAVWKRFGVTAQPAYAFIDAAGGVDVVTSQLSEQDLRERLSGLA